MSIDKAIEQIHEAFSDVRRDFDALLKRFDVLRVAYRELKRDATITVEQEENLLMLLKHHTKQPSVIALRTTRLEIIDILERRAHARKEGDRADDQ
jgi:hypothetical protein